MKITQFAKLVCKKEKGKKQIDIAQVMEILKVVNELLDDCLYTLIEWK